MRKIIFFLLLITACTKKQAVPTNEMTPVQLAERGKSIYMGNCIACHNVDPKIDGSIGPAVFGSSLALLDERILKGKYPAGYTPKRSTNAMVALPHLAAEIPALHAYLNSER